MTGSFWYGGASISTTQHNMFISCAHTDDVIDDALSRTEDAFKAIHLK